MDFNQILLSLKVLALEVPAKGASDAVSSGQIYSMLRLVMFGLCVACIVFAVIWFFRFNILKIINDFTGKNARKSIAKKRSENEKSGKKSFGPTPKAEERGPLTDKMRESQKLGKKAKRKAAKTGEATDVLPNRKNAPEGEATAILPNRIPNDKSKMVGEPTDVLPHKIPNDKSQMVGASTDVLPNRTGNIPTANPQTDIGEATSVLQSEATTVLNRNMAAETDVLPSKLETIQSIVLIHTQEVI